MVPGAFDPKGTSSLASVSEQGLLFPGLQHAQVDIRTRLLVTFIYVNMKNP